MGAAWLRGGSSRRPAHVPLQPRHRPDRARRAAQNVACGLGDRRPQVPARHPKLPMWPALSEPPGGPGRCLGHGERLAPCAGQASPGSGPSDRRCPKLGAALGVARHGEGSREGLCRRAGWPKLPGRCVCNTGCDAQTSTARPPARGRTGPPTPPSRRARTPLPLARSRARRRRRRRRPRPRRHAAAARVAGNSRAPCAAALSGLAAARSPRAGSDRSLAPAPRHWRRREGGRRAGRRARGSCHPAPRTGRARRGPAARPARARAAARRRPANSERAACVRRPTAVQAGCRSSRLGEAGGGSLQDGAGWHH